MRGQECGWKRSVKNGHILQYSFGRSLATSQPQWGRYVEKAYKGRLDSPTYFLGDCTSFDENRVLVGTALASDADLQDNTTRVHSKWVTRSSCASFYYYCNTWIVNSGEYDVRMALNLPYALHVVLNYGYQDLASADRVTIPPACPFHVHNDSLPAHERTITIKVETLVRHSVNIHILKLKQDIACPASLTVSLIMCTKADLIDFDQLKQHLIIDHNVAALEKTKEGAPEIEKNKSNKRKQNDLDSQENKKEN